LTFDNTIGEFERLQDDYIIMEKHVNLLEQASDIAEVREASQQIGIDIETWERTNILFNTDLYVLLVAYNQTENAALLSGQPRRLLDITLGDFQERGVGLSKHDRRLLQDWMGRLSELESTISGNIIDDMGEVDFTAEELKGLTDDQLAEFEYDTKTGKYKVLTATPSQDTDVMLYAINPNTRLKTVTGWLSRNKDKNGPLILETVQLRYVS
jgi:Zn-dependent oligopeptidase